MGNKRCYQDSLYYFEVESDKEEEQGKERFPTCLSFTSQPKEYQWRFGESGESKENLKERKSINWENLVDNVFRCNISKDIDIIKMYFDREEKAKRELKNQG